MAGFNDPNFCQPMTFKLNFTFVLFCFIFSIREEMDDSCIHAYNARSNQEEKFRQMKI